MNNLFLQKTMKIITIKKNKKTVPIHKSNQNHTTSIHHNSNIHHENKNNIKKSQVLSKAQQEFFVVVIRFIKIKTQVILIVIILKTQKIVENMSLC